MKSATPAMKAHLAQEVTTLCSCWLITRQDGVSLGFTDHDRSFTYNDQFYEAQEGYNRTAMTNDAGYSIDNAEVMGFLDSEKIKDEDLRNGVYNFANVNVFLVNFMDLSPTMGDVKLRRGWFGETTITQDGQFTIELRGMTQALSHDFIESYSPECRADFCDTRCKLNLADYSKAGVVTAVNNRTAFVMAPIVPTAQGFLLGSIVWTSGDNTGRRMEIADMEVWTIELFEGMAFDVKVGDTFTISSGCDKSRAMCKTYGNILNMRAEPDVPGQDQYLNYPDATQ